VAADATGVLTNTASISSDATNPEPGNDEATDTTRILTADLAVDETAPATATPGDSVVYTLVVTNGGPDGDPAARVLDTPPGSGSCTWTAAPQGGASGAISGAGALNETIDLPAGASMTYSLTCPIDPDASGTLVDTASVDSLLDDPDPADNTAIDDDTVVSFEADLAITKTDGLGQLVAGSTVQYAIEVRNDGPDNDPAARVTDNLTGALQCTWESAWHPVRGGPL